LDLHNNPILFLVIFWRVFTMLTDFIDVKAKPFNPNPKIFLVTIPPTKTNKLAEGKSKKGTLIIRKSWAMPNKNTFIIKPIHKLIEKYVDGSKTWIDPMANDSIFNAVCKFTNDLNPNYETTHHLDAIIFLKRFADNSIYGVLFDPPYSPRQLRECYDSIGRTLTQQDTQASFWSSLKNEIARIVKPNGLVLSFGWNSNGMGKNRGFRPIEILLVAHGGNHNDTICVVERKIGQKNVTDWFSNIGATNKETVVERLIRKTLEFFESCVLGEVIFDWDFVGFVEEEDDEMSTIGPLVDRILDALIDVGAIRYRPPDKEGVEDYFVICHLDIDEEVFSNWIE